MHKESESLLKKGEITREDIGKRVLSLKYRIVVHCARIRVYVAKDVIQREGQIHKEKVDIENHDSERQLKLATTQRSVFELGVSEDLLHHEEIKNDHESEREKCSENNRDYICGSIDYIATCARQGTTVQVEEEIRYIDQCKKRQYTEYRRGQNELISHELKPILVAIEDEYNPIERDQNEHPRGANVYVAFDKCHKPTYAIALN